MSDLLNYSIETDHTVLLSFKDGRRLRVHLDDLPRYLSAADLATITRAVKLRNDFIRRHMPKAALALVAGGLIALAGTTTNQLAAWWEHRTDPVSAPTETAPAPTSAPIVRNLQSGGTASPAPTPDAAIKENTAVATAPTANRAKAKTAHPPQVKKAARGATTPAGNVATTLPVPVPPPSDGPVTSPSPSPSASPTPTATPTPIPNQGQVLGDSTGPGDSDTTLPKLP
jgi:hypothetical protein